MAIFGEWRECPWRWDVNLGRVKNAFSWVLSCMSRSCWHTRFLQCWMNLHDDHENNLIQVLENWIKPSALSWRTLSLLGLWGRRDTNVFGCSRVVTMTNYLRDLYKPYNLLLPRFPFTQSCEKRWLKHRLSTAQFCRGQRTPHAQPEAFLWRSWRGLICLCQDKKRKKMFYLKIA